MVVNGTGGVGLNTVQGAKISGAEKFIELDLSDARFEASKQFGATHTVKVGKDEEIKVIKSLTGGEVQTMYL